MHSTEIIEFENGHKDIVGFAGQFSWINNELKSLDGDSYNPEITLS